MGEKRDNRFKNIVMHHELKTQIFEFDEMIENIRNNIEILDAQLKK